MKIAFLPKFVLNHLEPCLIQSKIPQYLLVEATGSLTTYWKGTALGFYGLQCEKSGNKSAYPVWKGERNYIFRFKSGKWGIGPYLYNNLYLRLISWPASANSPLDTNLVWRYYKSGWKYAENFKITEYPDTGK